MRRSALMLVVAALGLAAAALAAPESPPPPDFGPPLEPDVGAAARSSVWYCTWVDAGAERDSYWGLATAPEVTAALTLPSPIPATEPDRAVRMLFGPGAAMVDVAGIVRRGAAPGFVEFDDGPAAASATVIAESVLTGDRCVRSVPKVWRLAGGTTRDGRTLTLRLFNPFPDAAKVTVTGVSEFGPEPLPELSAIDVAGRAWRDVALGELVPFLDDLALTVEAEDGAIIPAVVVGGPGDEATWPGTGLSAVWEFPIAGLDGMASELILVNPGDVAVTVAFDAYTTTEAALGIEEIQLDPGAPRRLPVDVVLLGRGGLRLRADGPIAAALVAEDVLDEGFEGDEEEPPTDEPVPVRIAGTVGAPAPAEQWLLPGAGGVPGAASSIWVLNSGEAPATVTIQALAAEPLISDKVVVEAGTVRRIGVGTSERVAGYAVEGTSPITVSWVAEAPRGVMLMAGVAVE